MYTEMASLSFVLYDNYSHLFDTIIRVLRKYYHLSNYEQHGNRNERR